MHGRINGCHERSYALIHKTAIIDAKACLAEDVTVGAYSIIGPEVEIDAGTDIAPHVVINGPTRIGKNNKIFQFASIGDAPQDLKYAGEPTRLEIGEHNIIREYVTINRGTVADQGVTRIGDRNLFMAYAHVAHDCTIGSQTIFANAASLAGHVTVGDYATLGGFSCVHQFTTIGPYSFSGLGTVINRDVPPYVITAGNHAVAYGINKTGLRRHGFSPEVVAMLHKAFRLLIKSHVPRAEAMQQVTPLVQKCTEVAQFVAFIQNSQRGVVR